MSSIPWITTDTTLQYNVAGIYYLLEGFSLTATEYHSAMFNNTGWFDFGWYMYNNGVYKNTYANQTSSSDGNSGLNLNVYHFVKNILLAFVPNGSGTKESPYTAPCVRIPMCADLWLNGSSQQTTINSTDLAPYYWQGQSNVNFTGNQFQQAVVDLLYYIYTEWTVAYPQTPITFIIDLHWNYASPSPLTSNSYQTTTNNTSIPPSSSNSPINPTVNYSISNSSSQQLPLCGVCTSDGLGLVDNTIQFWNSVSNLLGVDSKGTPLGNPQAYVYTSSNGTVFSKSNSTVSLPTALLQGIFFELYNEPFTDYVTSSTTTYSNGYELYINGGTGTYQNSTYSFTGFKSIYNTIRNVCGCQNLIILPGSDNYAYFSLNTSLNNGQWDNTTNSINNTYNCFTKLRDSIVSSGWEFKSIMIGLHPYSGLYTGGGKHPGFYDSSYYSENPSGNLQSNTQIAGFGQLFSALQNPSLTNFYMSCPIICTEFGQYDLPFSTYATNQSLPATSFQYPDSYLNANASNPSLYYFLGSSSYGKPYYNGNYVDANGNNMALPAIIGYLKDFKYHNVNFCVWAVRPNAGGCGQVYSTGNGSNDSLNYLISNNNIYYNSWVLDYNAWGASQPDVTTGSWCSYPQRPVAGSIWSTTPTSTIAPTAPINATPPANTVTPNNNYTMQLIGSSNQDVSSSTYNYGCQGPDFQYILSEYFNK
jgi:hypothetical protein